MKRAISIVNNISDGTESKAVLNIVAAELHDTIVNLSSNLVDMAAGIEMADACATFYLHKLINMIPADKAMIIMSELPMITKKAIDEAVGRV